MIHLLRKSLRLGMLGGIAYGVWKMLRARGRGDAWQSEPWVSTGAPGATVPKASPAATAPSATPAGGAPPVGVAPATETPTGKTNGEAVPTPVGEDPVEGDGKASGEAVEPARPAAPARATKAKTGPARKAPTGKAEEPPGERLWVPANEGVCPPTHPVKAKLSSKIFHTPGGRNYSRTHADRCYPDEASAQADGLRPALR